MPNPFAVIIPAASGVGLELSRIAARQGYDLLIAAADPAIQDVVGELQYEGIYIEALEYDVSSDSGVNRVLDAADGKDIDLLCLDVGANLGGAFLERDMDDWRHGLDGSITGSLHMIQHVLAKMVLRGEGRVLITGAAPTGPDAIYRGTKAFFEGFTQALQAETAQAPGVLITTLIQAPLESSTPMPMREAGLARQAWDAMMAGEHRLGMEA